MNRPTIKVLIADDHPIIRKALKDLIKETDHIICIGEATDGYDAFEKFNEFNPDVVIMDIDMPIMNGLDVSKKILHTHPNAKISILTMHKESVLYDKAMQLGIKGYILKDAILDELINCIDELQKGNSFISPTVFKYLEKKKVKEFSADLKSKYGLTISEINIFKQVAVGKSTKDISTALFISEKTVESHRRNIVKKLGIDGSKTTLAKFILENKDLI